LEPIARRLDALPGELVDAGDGARQALIDEMEGLEGRRRVLLVEIGELRKREHVAYMAIFEAREAEAQRVFEEAGATKLARYAEAKAVSAQLLRALNGSIPDELEGDRDGARLYIVDLRAEDARAWAISGNAAQDERRARAAWKRARAATAEARNGQARVIEFRPGPVAA
jgi:hypothetical protein